MLLVLTLACDLGVPVDGIDPDDPRYANLGGGSSTTTSSDTGSTHVVLMRGLSFDPEELTIHVGDTVVWVNEDTAFHIVAAGNPGSPTAEFTSPAIQVGQEWGTVFETAGDYVYFCDNHERVMRDAIIHVAE